MAGAAVVGAAGVSVAVCNLLLAAALPRAELGLVNLIQAVAFFASGFASLGAAQAVPRLVGLSGDDAGGIAWSRLFRTVLLRRILPLSAVVSVGGALWYRWDPFITAAAAVLILSQGAAMLAGNVLRARGQAIAGQFLVQQWRLGVLVVVGLPLLALGTRVTVGAVVALFALVGAVGLVWSAIAVRARGGSGELPPESLGRLYREGWHFLGVSVSLAVLNYADRLLLPQVSGLEGLATYSVAWWILGTPFTLVQTGVGFSLLPRLRQLGRTASGYRVLRTQAVIVAGVGLAMALTALLFGRWVFAVLYGTRYAVSPALVASLVGVGMLRLAYAVPSSVVGAWGTEDDLRQLSRWGWPAVAIAVSGVYVGGKLLGLPGVAAGAAAGVSVRLASAIVLARSRSRATVPA